MLKIPKTMATQHPDNAGAPYWKADGKPFVSSLEEVSECVEVFRSLDVEEFMWDWEGKFADEAVIDKLFYHYLEFFKKNPLGVKKRLTFRIPNIWEEKGYSLIRALMVVLTSEDFARDLKFRHPPLFEVILPMTESARQLIFIQKSFRELARLKSKMFVKFQKNHDYLSIIPLFEGVDTQIRAKKILIEYLKIHKKTFGFLPSYLRVFIARSDPAMVSGLVSTVLANKIILSDLRELENETGIKIYPIMGAGSLPFRGNLNPESTEKFSAEYPGVVTVTPQSAFRYDYPLGEVKKAVEYYNQRPVSKSQIVPEADRKKMIEMINIFEKEHQSNMSATLPDLQFLINSFPRRRERHLHIGLLAYGRKVKNAKLPRAINFTGSFYSLGIPPEFLDIGGLLQMRPSGLSVLNKYYKNYSSDLDSAGRYLSRGNLKTLSAKSKNWQKIEKNIAAAESLLEIKFKPVKKDEIKHGKLAGKILRSKTNHAKITSLIEQAGVLRKSLG